VKVRGSGLRTPELCETCGLAKDPKQRARNAARLPVKERSLFLCRECGLVVPQRKLPPAVEYHGGRVWSSDPALPQGVALFYDPSEDTFLLTGWQTPFLECPPQRLSRARLKSLLGLE
jgi:hypothetical protein